jgi:GGDEF domain-containing protein
LGGDEFLVILPECPPQDVQIVLSRLTSFEVDCDGKKVAVSSSRGWAQHRLTETPEQLMKRADRALYEEKAAPAKFALVRT